MHVVNHLSLDEIRELVEISDPLLPIFSPSSMRVALEELDRLSTNNIYMLDIVKKLEERVKISLELVAELSKSKYARKGFPE